MWTYFKHLPIRSTFKENPDCSCILRKISNETDMFGFASNSVVVEDPNKTKMDFHIQIKNDVKVWELI